MIFEPFYENYGPDAILSGAVAALRDAARRRTGRSTATSCAGAFSTKTRAIIVNTPNNPTGKVFTRDELEFIAGLCREYDALAITDEIYEHILYDGAEHVTIATLPGMAERTVTISGAVQDVQRDRLAGGLDASRRPSSPPRIRKVHDFLTVGAAAPLQEAGAVALALPDEYYRALAAAYARRRDRLVPILQRAGFALYVPRGAYYVMTDIDGLGWDDDVAFARHLVEDVGVAVVPGSSFYRDPRDGRRQVRFAFCKKDETLDEAERRLARLKPR